MSAILSLCYPKPDEEVPFKFHSRASSAARAYCVSHNELGIHPDQIESCLHKVSFFVTTTMTGELMLKKKHCSELVPRTTYVKMDADLVKIWIVGSRVLGEGRCKKVKGAIEISYCRSTRELHIGESAFCIRKNKEKALLERSIEESLDGVPNIIKSFVHTDFTVTRASSAAGGAGAEDIAVRTTYYSIQPRAGLGDIVEFWQPNIKLEEGMSKTRASLIGMTCAAQTLSALHARGYFFSDMKPENLLGLNTNQWVIGDLESITKVERFFETRRSIYTSCHTSKEYILLRTYKAEVPTTFSTSAVDVWTLGTSILRILNEDFFYYVFLGVNLEELDRSATYLEGKSAALYCSKRVIDAVIMLSEERIRKAITAVDVLDGMSAGETAALCGQMGEGNFSKMRRHLERVKIEIGDLRLRMLQALLLRMLQINPAMRISTEQAHAELEEITEGFELERAGLPKS